MFIKNKSIFLLSNMSAFLQKLIKVDFDAWSHAFYIFIITCVTIKGMYSFSILMNIWPIAFYNNSL